MNEPLFVWVATYYDDVAGEDSFDVFDSLETAKAFTNKLKAERVISNVVIDQRRVIDEPE
tara:strand:+ start:271 stop:450 length:180 start_codon:yes stop_codon:yes gene_type:complete